MVTATVTSKGQITIPKVVRDSLHIRCGDRVEIVVQGDSEAILKPITKSVDEVFGKLHDPSQRSKSVEEMKESVAKMISQRT